MSLRKNHQPRNQCGIPEPYWEMPGERSQTLTWVGQVDLLRGSAGSLWGPLDSQGEKEEQTAAGPAGTRGAHGRGKVGSRKGKEKGLKCMRSLQNSRSGWGGWGKKGDQAKSHRGREHGREVFTGTVIQMLEKKQKKTVIATKRQMPSEPRWLLSTLHRLTHGSLTTFRCVVATVIISPISQMTELSNGVTQLHGSGVMERGLEPRGPGSRALALIHRSLSMQEAWEWGWGVSV